MFADRRHRRVFFRRRHRRREATLVLAAGRRSGRSGWPPTSPGAAWGEAGGLSLPGGFARTTSPASQWKSLYLVFGLQGGAGLGDLPAAAGSAIGGRRPAWPGSTPCGIASCGLVGIGVRGRRGPATGTLQGRPRANRGKVLLRSGLWRYTRHPELLRQLPASGGAFFLLALSAGGWWSVISPLLMTFLLLKVSGVAMLEKDIGDRRPDYADYVARTNAFFPGMPKEGASQ